MNEVFIIGKILSQIDFRFILNNKKYFSKIEFKIEVDKQKLKVKGYNDIAEFCYRKLKKNDIICINGEIETNMEIIIKYIEII